MHLTVFNVVGRLVLIGDAGGAVEEDGAEFLSSPDAGTLSCLDFSPLCGLKDARTLLLGHTHTLFCDILQC